MGKKRAGEKKKVHYTKWGSAEYEGTDNTTALTSCFGKP